MHSPLFKVMLVLKTEQPSKLVSSILLMPANFISHEQTLDFFMFGILNLVVDEWYI